MKTTHLLFLFTVLAVAAFISPNAQAQIITTIAGNHTYGYSGDGGQATAAQLWFPFGVAVDGSRNVYIADEENDVIRKMTAATGIITTIAGNNTGGYSGDGGQATAAQLYNPFAVAVDGSGNVYIADEANNVIRKVTAATGIITTIAGNNTHGYSGDGGQATAAQLYFPNGVAVDGSGNVYIADRYNQVIREVVAATGIIITIAGNYTNGYSGDGGQATAAQLFLPSGVAVDGSGNVYIADEASNVIRKVAAATGIITTIAGNHTGGYSGDSGQATAAQLYGPYEIALDGSGNVYIADGSNNVIRKVTNGPASVPAVSSRNRLNVTLFPNPATNSAVITYSGADKNITVRVMDVTGRILYATTANGQSGAILLPLQGLSSGYYMVMLQSGNRQVVDKLVKE